ncbi:hypothetical protein [Kordiimonas pumila]|uniref:Uncharacterized protein n=1 Tax=Kordiimonas pumila TaxID=2161677 RepID=A0ABV7D3S6_9PROT|nr:hypothetical protein [Kordiimonas pumila]
MTMHANAAQSQNRGNDIVIKKKDGKLTSAITAQTSNTYPRLISDIELLFVWSSIVDQPTKYYQFIWNKSDRAPTALMPHQ